MFRPPLTEMWRVGLVPAPITALVHPAAWAELAPRVVWLPDPGSWRYVADPFGLKRGGMTHVFVEAFDYRTLHGVIEHHEFAPDLTWCGKTTVLTLPHHASYPFIVEDGGEVFMIPETYRSNEIVLYRARRFPGEWLREAILLAGVPGAEASLFKHEGHWWMFFTVVVGGRDERELHVAYADRLTGPWRLHPQNPVVDDVTGGRPGGTPFAGADGVVTLPVQDCGRTYGGAIRFARFTTLSRTHVVVEHAKAVLTGDLLSPADRDGFHTLASCGEITLIDVKRFVPGWGRHMVNFRRRLAKRGFGHKS